MCSMFGASSEFPLIGLEWSLFYRVVDSDRGRSFDHENGLFFDYINARCAIVDMVNDMDLGAIHQLTSSTTIANAASFPANISQ